VAWAAGPRLAGRIADYGASIYLADAALYLRAHDPSLGIRDPYELTSGQLQAAVSLVRRQHDRGSETWATWPDEVLAFAQGEVEAGVGRGIVAALTGSVPIRAAAPREGMTGWADAWMATAHAVHPNCMERWLRWTTQPSVQSEVAEWDRAAPANPRACPLVRRAVGPAADGLVYGECGNTRFLRSLWLWRTPSGKCGDGRRDCTDYRAWLKAFASITG
jgi:putative spermidine/putrescine transport system substrate-binding protein